MVTQTVKIERVNVYKFYNIFMQFHKKCIKNMQKNIFSAKIIHSVNIFCILFFL